MQFRIFIFIIVFLVFVFCCICCCCCCYCLFVCLFSFSNLFPQYIAFHFLIDLSVCKGQCPNPDTFEFIPEENYDRDFASVTPGERPLGFEFTILYYEADGQPNPCYEIPDTNDRRVEIMAEPDGGGSSQLWYVYIAITPPPLFVVVILNSVLICFNSACKQLIST